MYYLKNIRYTLSRLGIALKYIIISVSIYFKNSKYETLMEAYSLFNGYKVIKVI